MKIIQITDTHYASTIETPYILEEFFKDVIKLEPDILVHSGDLISSRQAEYPIFVSMLRFFFPKIPILVVDGNHDFWNLEPDDRGGGLFDKKYMITVEDV